LACPQPQEVVIAQLAASYEDPAIKSADYSR
jgi:hypothetical protein